jgi:hypothetical protein
VRKILFGIISTLFLFASLQAPAHAQVISVELVERPHQLLTEEFFDDELATALAPAGRLGSLVFSPIVSGATWYIDGAFLDEVAAMADGYELANGEDGVGEDVARLWLEQLRIAIAGAKIVPLAYGNPDLSLATTLAPSELTFYYQFGQARVAFHLGREISPENIMWKSKSANLDSLLRKNYTKNRQAVAKLVTVVAADELQLFRARLATLLSPSLKGELRKKFADSAVDGVAAQNNKLRVNSGRYSLTSEKVGVPLTLVNEFSTEVKVNLIFRTSNVRVLVDDIGEITLAPNSRTQLSVPFTVIASGTTNVSAILKNEKGRWLGPSSRLSLRMTIIDPRVAWFTTGAAVLLFAGALGQTYRRIRRGRK